MNQTIVCLTALIALAACSSNPKKVIVYFKGNSTANAETKTITVKDGAGAEEKTMDFNTAEKVSLKIEGLDEDATVEIPENGLYIVNAKNDTIIGSYQKYSDPKTSQTVITQEQLKKDIDSLTQLTMGKNISAANRNFYILPKQAAKISNNIESFVVGPFHKMTSVAKEGDKEPEVYRFYSIKEIRETIQNLTKLTIAEKKQ
ncbi:MAG: hypothetical protein ACOVNY_01940 [Chitinophagaceae bacterium]